MTFKSRACTSYFGETLVKGKVWEIKCYIWKPNIWANFLALGCYCYQSMVFKIIMNTEGFVIKILKRKKIKLYYGTDLRFSLECEKKRKEKIDFQVRLCSYGWSFWGCLMWRKMEIFMGTLRHFLATLWTVSLKLIIYIFLFGGGGDNNDGRKRKKNII